MAARRTSVIVSELPMGYWVLLYIYRAIFQLPSAFSKTNNSLFSSGTVCSLAFIINEPFECKDAILLSDQPINNINK